MKTGKINVLLGIRIAGATLGAAGLYLTAFQYNLPGAILLGVGGILIAVGDKP